MKDLGDNKDPIWVHAECFAMNNVDFAICMRCRKGILRESDAVSSSFAAREGFVHVGCSNRKRKAVLVLEDPFSTPVRATASSEIVRADTV